MRPRLLDLFCGAGGSARGYQEAGFYVVGVDHKPQPHYVGDAFVLMDALDAMRILLSGGFITDTAGRKWYLSDFVAIHASPPCQRYTLAQNAAKNAHAHPDLVGPVRDALVSTGKPYVIENVVGSPLINASMLCGLSFGLKVRRHRLFEASFFLLTKPCQCHKQDYFVIFGHETRCRRHGDKAGRKNKIAEGRAAMGIDWMTRAELSEAVPPAYTELVGKQLMQAVNK